MNTVLRTMQMVMARSVNGSITIRLTKFLNLSHAGQQSQIRKVLENLYQQGGHVCLDSSSSDTKQADTIQKTTMSLMLQLFDGFRSFRGQGCPTFHGVGYNTGHAQGPLSGHRASQEVHGGLIGSALIPHVLCV